MTLLLDGKKLAQTIRKEIAAEIQTLKNPPGLAVIIVGSHPASQIYVKNKRKACSEVGIYSELLTLPETISQTELLAHIAQLNQNPRIHGILVQLPLPAHLSTRAVIHAIDPRKDIDGFHPLNMGKLLLGETDGFIPCTPLGVHQLLQQAQIDLTGQHVVILGRSNIVGKPLAALLMQKAPHCNATVTVAHSQSKALTTLCQSADVLVAAMGQPLFVKAEMVKKGALVIDVGMNRLPDRLVGDVDFTAVAPKCSAITPVPGGVGPMTIAMLLHNTLKAFKSI